MRLGASTKTATAATVLCQTQVRWQSHASAVYGPRKNRGRPCPQTPHPCPEKPRTTPNKPLISRQYPLERDGVKDSGEEIGS